MQHGIMFKMGGNGPIEVDETFIGPILADARKQA